MKYLRTRQEIGLAMNFGKYPVLTVDHENPVYPEHPNFCRGCRVRVAWDHKSPEYNGCASIGNLCLEDGKLFISGDGSFVTSHFGYSEVMRDALEAQAPIVHAGETVVVVDDWSKTKMCTVRLMKISERCDFFSSTVCTVDDID